MVLGHSQTLKLKHKHTYTLPVRDTEPLCVSSSARSHRPVPWPHVRLGRAASCAVSPSHGLTLFSLPSSGLPTPQPHRDAAAPSRTDPGLGPSFPGAEGVSEVRRLLKQQVPRLLPYRARPGLESRRRTRRSQGRGLRDGRGPVRGRRWDRTRRRAGGARGAGPGLRHPPRQRTSSETRGGWGRHSGPHLSGPTVGNGPQAGAPWALLTWPPIAAPAAQLPAPRGARPGSASARVAA